MIEILSATAPMTRLDTGPHLNKRSPTPTDLAVGVKIRLLRHAAGMTLRELGEAVGVSFVQFQRYETGASRIPASRLIAISKALCVRIESLVSDASPTESEPVSGVDRGESGELLRLFKSISDPGQRRAIIALVGAMADREEQSGLSSGGFLQNGTATSNGAQRPTARNGGTD
jgi:transcriptional regulator with XRE-family HTH domain